MLAPVHEVYEALVLGTRDYVRKNGFTDVVDRRSPAGSTRRSSPRSRPTRSGPSTCIGVLMPSRYSSEGSVTDADALAANLGIRTLTIPIEPAHTAFLEMLGRAVRGREPGLAEENLQARIRGERPHGALATSSAGCVLTTGNKSEMAIGYSTLYGATWPAGSR